MIAPDRISLLSTNRDEIEKLTYPYFVRLDAGLPSTPEEQNRLDSLIMQYGELCEEIDSCWNNMVIRKTSIIRRFFKKS